MRDRTAYYHKYYIEKVKPKRQAEGKRERTDEEREYQRIYHRMYRRRQKLKRTAENEQNISKTEPETVFGD